MKFKFNLRYFLLTVALFITEVLIAAYLHDAIIRPFIGDLLVVILVYSAVKSILNLRVWPAAIGALLFAYLVEFGQYLHILNWLGWEHSRAAQIIMGTYFTWTDMLMYTLGILLVVIVENMAGNLNAHQKTFTN